MNLAGTEVANAAVVAFALVIAITGRLGRGRIRVLVVPEVGGDLGLLERAVRRSRREGELERQQQKKR